MVGPRADLPQGYLIHRRYRKPTEKRDLGEPLNHVITQKLALCSKFPDIVAIGEGVSYI